MGSVGAWPGSGAPLLHPKALAPAPRVGSRRWTEGSGGKPLLLLGKSQPRRGRRGRMPLEPRLGHSRPRPCAQDGAAGALVLLLQQHPGALQIQSPPWSHRASTFSGYPRQAAWRRRRAAHPRLRLSRIQTLASLASGPWDCCHVGGQGRAQRAPHPRGHRCCSSAPWSPSGGGTMAPLGPLLQDLW